MRSSTTRPPIARGSLFDAGSFAIPGLQGDRRITVYLPPGYERSDRRYPVAYMFDGQNVFGDAGSFAGGWRLHDLLDRRAARRKRVAIVIGVHHGGVHRAQDLSPWRIGRHSGELDALLTWLTTFLKPKVDGELRTLADPGNTMVGGSSLGGLAALYALFRHPQAFGKALAMSPALWVGQGAIFPFLERVDLPWDPRVYLDCSVREGRGWSHGQAQAAAEILARRGLVPGHHLLWRSDPRGGHTERTWRRRLPRALAFLLDGRPG